MDFKLLRCLLLPVCLSAPLGATGEEIPVEAEAQEASSCSIQKKSFTQNLSDLLATTQQLPGLLRTANQQLPDLLATHAYKVLFVFVVALILFVGMVSKPIATLLYVTKALFRKDPEGEAYALQLFFDKLLHATKRYGVKRNGSENGLANALSEVLHILRAMDRLLDFKKQNNNQHLLQPPYKLPPLRFDLLMQALMQDLAVYNYKYKLNLEEKGAPLEVGKYFVYAVKAIDEIDKQLKPFFPQQDNA